MSDYSSWILKIWSNLLHLLKQGHDHNGDRAARRPHILRSICVHSFWALAKAVRLFIASLYNQPMYPKMWSIDIFVSPQPVGWNLKVGIFNLQVWEFRRRKGYGWAHSIVRLWIPISSPFLHVVYLLPVLSNLAVPKKHFSPPIRQSARRTMTNTEHEATASSSGN